MRQIKEEQELEGLTFQPHLSKQGSVSMSRSVISGASNDRGQSVSSSNSLVQDPSRRLMQYGENL
jgi:hypothetical protein